MRWSYKTVHYHYKKEGLLGGVFLDEAEIEESMNEFGRAGWELVSFIEVQEGLIATFKQPIERPTGDRRLAERTVPNEGGPAPSPRFFRPEKKMDEDATGQTEQEETEDAGRRRQGQDDRAGTATRSRAPETDKSGNGDDTGGIGSIRIE